MIQNHLVFALKLSRGDMSVVARVPRMLQLAMEVEELVRDLGAFFPVLDGWLADEISLHHYDVPEIGLGFHADNTCFDGVIVVVNVSGIKELAVKDQDRNIHVETIFPGDIGIMRATGFFEIERDAVGKIINQCPDHQVQNLSTPTSTSFIVRANRYPERPIPGFTYDNWSPDMI